MSWSAAFLGALAAPERPRLQVLIEGWDPNPSWATAAWAISSHLGLPGAQILCRDGWDQGGARVAPRTWIASAGALTFRVARDPEVLRRMIRGQFVRVRLGPVGWPASALETVGLYQLWDLQGQRAGVSVVCRDLLSALQSRPTKTQGKASLFEDLTTTGITSSAGYTAASGSLTVSSTTLLRRQDDGGGALKGLVKINGDGEVFFRTWTAKTSTVLTVSTSAYNLNTADVSVGSGAAVTEAAFLDDHPLAAVARILLSSGTALFRGPYDTLPETWGYALPRWAVDEDDIAAGVARTQPAAGSADWTIWSDAPAPDGIAWIEGWLCQGGYCLATRQGRLTARPIYSITQKIDAWLLDDREIVEVIAWSAWDPSAIEATTLNVWGATGTGGTSANSSTEALATLPGEASANLDLVPFVTENVSAIKTEIGTRLRYWYLRVPERLRVRCGGLRLAAAAPGDLLVLSSRVLRSRLGAFGYRRGLVVEVSPDWLGGWVTLEILIAPEDGQIGS